jgi:hypothetical protein
MSNRAFGHNFATGEDVRVLTEGKKWVARKFDSYGKGKKSVIVSGEAKKNGKDVKGTYEEWKRAAGPTTNAQKNDEGDNDDAAGGGGNDQGGDHHDDDERKGPGAGGAATAIKHEASTAIKHEA